MSEAKSNLIKDVWFGASDRPHCIFLMDGTKITVGRTRETKGPAWLEIGQAAKIVACNPNPAVHGGGK